METYDSDDDPDYEPSSDCLYLEIEKDKLINQLARFMTMYKQSIKKIKELETKLNK